MKRLIKYAAYCVCLCVFLGVAIFICTKRESSIVETNASTETIAKDSKWLREVNYSLNLTTRVSSDEQVVLKDYKYLGVVDSKAAKEELIDDIFYNEAVTIRYGSDLGSIVFYTWKELDEYYSEYNNKFIADISDKIEVGKTEALELTWLYKGVIYKSKAIVDNEEGIVFDNIASYALDYSSKKPRQVNHSRGRLSPTRSLDSLGMLDSLDSIGGDSTRVFTFELSDMADEIELVTGETAWWYNIRVISIFNSDNILYSGKCYANYDSARGWDCKAAAETIGGEEDVSKYHKFAWAWSYGNDTTITISFAGNGFSMTGGDRGASGEEIHRPSSN